MSACPHGHPLEGLGTYCWTCHDEGRDGAVATEPEAAKPNADRPPDTRLEREVRHAITETLTTLGYHVTDLEQERPTRVTEGVPDLWVMGRGRYTWAELKRPSRRDEAHGGLSEHQRRWHRTAHEAGAPCTIWYDEHDALAWHEEAA